MMFTEVTKLILLGGLFLDATLHGVVFRFFLVRVATPTTFEIIDERSHGVVAAIIAQRAMS